MFLNLNHQNLSAYSESKKFVMLCYKITQAFPSEEKFGLISQIRRAAISVHLNISEGASRKSVNERKRYFEISRGSIIEIDAALEIANELGYLNKSNINEIENSLITVFKLLSGLIKTKD